MSSAEAGPDEPSDWRSRHLERRWADLALPDTAAPPSFADAVMARIAVAEPAPPAWAPLAAAAALAVGIALGIGLGRLESPGAPPSRPSPPWPRAISRS